MNATAFYTYGYGYYRQYKDDAWLAGYTNLQSDIEQADLIREKIMRNHLGGINASAAYSVRNLDLTFGGSWSYYSCPHWGTLDWVDGLKKSDIRGRWYDNDVDKQDANVFVRANWTVARGLRLFADMQYRYVHYQAWGVNDNYNWDTSAMQPIDVDKKYHFFNRARASITRSPTATTSTHRSPSHRRSLRAATSPTVICSPATTRIPRPRNSTTMNLATGTTHRNSAQA